MPTPLPTNRSAHRKRNEEIRERYEAGESLAQLAQAFDISSQRVQQIMKGRHH